MRAANANLDPDSYRHEITDRPAFQISQVDHGFQVRAVAELHISCSCGRPLCGIETDVMQEHRGFAIYYRGVCLSCGRQEGMYVSPAALPTAEAEQQRRDDQLKADIARILEQVGQLNEAAGNEMSPEPIRQAAVAAVEAA
jgi:hypothetical protein